MSREITPEHRAAVKAMEVAAPTLEERRARLEGANTELAEVCMNPRNRWRMRVPVQPDDTDMVIGAALIDAEASLNDLEAFKAKWESVPWVDIRDAAYGDYNAEERLSQWWRANRPDSAVEIPEEEAPQC